MKRTTILSASVGALLVLILPAAAEEAHGPRIPLVSPDTQDPDAAAIFRDLRARGTEPLNLHRVYANAPKLSRRFSAVTQALRNDATVPRADRELIILRATQIVHGDYQHGEHKPIAMSCGISAAQIEGLPHWRDGNLFNERQRAVLAYADGMFSEAGVNDASFAEMKRFFSPKEIVELTMTAAHYAASSQMARALGVTAEGNPPPSAYGKC